MQLDRRVVITGLGIISPMGLDAKTTWEALADGRSSVGPITHFDASNFSTKIAAEVKGFDPVQFMDRKDARHMDRFTQFAMAASLQAVEQANLKLDGDTGDETGVIIGSGMGGLDTLHKAILTLSERGPGRINPFLAPMMMADSASGNVSIRLGARAANFCTTSACASGADAIGEAFEIIKRGDARVMLAGGSDALITPITIAAFNAARALSVNNDDPQHASRPFDKTRDGFVVGEGSAILVMESLDVAIKRGATILAEFAGYGATADAFHITQPDDKGLGGARAMKRALDKSGLVPEEVEYINAHGTATVLNDKCETLAIKSVFGDYAYRVPISSTKSMMGHLLGAAGAIEAAICVLTMQNSLIPPTINYQYPDPECDLDYVPDKARRGSVRVAMSNSFGFGGHNSVLLFKEYRESS
ncbi:MAG: beta-ketoacyl-ACP synthase II [Dehalococcoidia bacterium]|nr:beta-ketoacyl-ACP synthase II [Dehalococcoidia bacterium]